MPQHLRKTRLRHLTRIWMFHTHIRFLIQLPHVPEYKYTKPLVLAMASLHCWNLSLMCILHERIN